MATPPPRSYTIYRYRHPLWFARRKGIVAGVLGGSRKWLVLGGLAWFIHILGKALGTGEPTIRYSEDLLPGERILITHEATPPGRRRRKRGA